MVLQGQAQKDARTPSNNELSPAEVTDAWRTTLSAIGSGTALEAAQIRFAMEQIMSGAASEAHTAAFAHGLLAKGITPAELDAAAEVMLSLSTPVTAPDLTEELAARAVDIVGTGGDGAHTVNISTMSAVVVAAAGVPVLKHGNRAASSRSGGADMLEALGVDISDGRVASAEHPDFVLQFLFAARYHPAMRHAAPVRKQLSVPTVFNLLGPLTNPMRPHAGLIGCAFPALMEPMAHTFARRGHNVVVVRGNDGLDEVTVTDTTRALVVSAGSVVEETIDPRDYGMKLAAAAALQGGDPTYNAEVARQVWAGELTGAVHDAVALNSAVALAVARGVPGSNLTAAVAQELESVRSILSSGLCWEIIRAAIASQASS